MSDLFDLSLPDLTQLDEVYLLAGWNQWADAGGMSSALPRYLIEALSARKIGEINADGFYLFQVPGTHHLLRPEVRFVDGYCETPPKRENQFFFAESNGKGVVIFLGEEPHMAVDRYADAFLEVAQAVQARRVVTFGGVYGEVPFDKERNISSTYSLRPLKDELSNYGLRFSNYQGGASIGSYLTHRAREANVYLFTLYAFVPTYDFSKLSVAFQGIRIEHDYRAWYDALRRVNHLFDLGLNLTDLAQESESLRESVAAKLMEMNEKMPQVDLSQYLAEINEAFTEVPFMPLGDVWERELGDLLDDFE